MRIKLNQWRLIALLIGFAFLTQTCEKESSTNLEENQISTESGLKNAKHNNKIFPKEQG